jgi:hypothetical protein
MIVGGWQLANGPWLVRPRSNLVENSPGMSTTVFVLMSTTGLHGSKAMAGNPGREGAKELPVDPVEKVRHGAEVLLGILRD